MRRDTRIISTNIPYKRCRSSGPGIYPDPPGGYNPQFSCDTPNHLKFKGGYQGGVYGGCLCDRDGMGNKRGQILT